MSTETGISSGFHFGPFYYERTSNGDTNIGIALGVSWGEGAVAGVEGYAEISYNKNDGFSAGYGVNSEAGLGVNLGPGLKDLSCGVYTTTYVSKDSRE